MVSCLEVPLSQARKAFAQIKAEVIIVSSMCCPAVANLMWNFGRFVSRKTTSSICYPRFSSNISKMYLEICASSGQWARYGMRKANPWHAVNFWSWMEPAQRKRWANPSPLPFHGKAKYRWWEGCTEKSRQRKRSVNSFFFFLNIRCKRKGGAPKVA